MTVVIFTTWYKYVFREERGKSVRIIPVRILLVGD